MDRIEVTDKPARQINPEEFAKALGAEKMTEEEVIKLHKQGKLPNVPLSGKFKQNSIKNCT